MNSDMEHLLSLFEQARLSTHHGDIVRAKEQYRLALHSAQRIKSDLGKALALLELGRIALNVEGNIEQAKRLLADSARIYARIGFDLGRAHTLVSSGTLALMEGKSDVANENFKAALLIFEKEHNQEGMARVLHAMFRMDFEAGNLQSAERHLLKGLDLMETTEDYAAIGQTYLALGALQLKHHQDIQQAKTLFAKALDTFEKLGYTRDANQARHNLSEIDRVEKHMHDQQD